MHCPKAPQDAPLQHLQHVREPNGDSLMQFVILLLILHLKLSLLIFKGVF